MTDRTIRPTASLGFGLIATPKKSDRKKTEDAPPENRRPKILVVDSDPETRRHLVVRLGAANYSVDSADDGQAALDACVRSRPNLVVTDLRLTSMDGLALLKELKTRWPDVVVIILTAYGTIQLAVKATQCGAFGFLIRPVERAELLGQVERAIAASTYSPIEGNWRADIVSRSQLMEDRLALANKAAASDAPILLTGENGTGKELLARAIHAAGERRERPFVALSCRNIDVEVLQDALLGKTSRVGTLLLDEVGELPSNLQALLSRAVSDAYLSSIAVENSGYSATRVICTTSRDLKELIARGEFRQDLYYQISVLPIDLPPLGRRREDIPLLVSHFLEQATEKGGTQKIYSPKAIEMLTTADWPGNVRQLFELVKQNVALSQGEVMNEDLVQKSLGKDLAKIPTYDEARDEFARGYLVNNLQTTSGNISESARLAKRNRTDFYKLLARYRLHPDSFKRSGPQHSKGAESDGF